jgi:hypothetical protein
MRTSVNSMVLTELIEPLHDALPAVEHAGPDARQRLCIDSRCARPGDLPSPRRARADGLRFAHGRWSAARWRWWPTGRLAAAACLVGVSDVSAAKAILADRFFGQPSKRLDVAGIRHQRQDHHVLHAALDPHHGRSRRRASIGTLGAWIGQRHEPLLNTTPDAVELRAAGAQGGRQPLRRGHGVAATLVQQRARGSSPGGSPPRPTLDYGTMEVYARPRAGCSDADEDGTAVLNAADSALARPDRHGRARSRVRAQRAGRVRADVLRPRLLAPQFRQRAGRARSAHRSCASSAGQRRNAGPRDGGAGAGRSASPPSLQGSPRSAAWAGELRPDFRCSSTTRTRRTRWKVLDLLRYR